MSVLGSAVVLSIVLTQAETPWRYVVPAPGEPQRVPVLTPLSVSTSLPEDAALAGLELGADAAFAQLRYGEADSVRVLVALDRSGNVERLHVDLDRDRKLEADEFIAATEGGWEVALPVVAKTKDGAGSLERRVFFRRGSTGTTFSCGTLGFLEGPALLGDREIQSRRMDCDANGFVTDPRDQLWLDLDGDGKWESLGELFLFAPTIVIDGKRYAPRSDRIGTSLALEEIQGTGRIVLALGEDIEAKPISLNVLLVGRDGCAVGVRALGEPIEVPVGEYRVGMVTLWLPDPDGGADWGYVFSDSGASGSTRWRTIEAGGTSSIDPLGELAFQVSVGSARPRPGESLLCRPSLTTEDGLTINNCMRGRASNGSGFEGAGARLRLLSPDGEAQGSATSGFA